MLLVQDEILDSSILLKSHDMTEETVYFGFSVPEARGQNGREGIIWQNSKSRKQRDHIYPHTGSRKRMGVEYLYQCPKTILSGV